MHDRDQEQPQQPAQASSDALEGRGLDRDTEDRIIAMAVEIMERRMERGDVLADPQMAGRYCAGKIRHYDREVFGVLFLDTRHRALGFELMFFGTLDGAEVHPREVARAALRYNAAALIVCHNHPSGNPEPSAADRAVTARLKQALALIDVRLLDHFVIADGPPVSLAARGWV